MNKPAIEAALAELNAQQATQPGEDRTEAIESALEKLNRVAPATINRTVGPIRQFIHDGEECHISISITPKIFQVIVNWD